MSILNNKIFFIVEIKDDDYTDHFIGSGTLEGITSEDRFLVCPTDNWILGYRIVDSIFPFQKDAMRYLEGVEG